MPRVFVIEKEQQWRSLLSEAFPLPYQTFFSTDCDRAWRILRREDYDVVIVDLRPTEFNGTGKLQKLREAFPHTPLIATSRSDTPDFIVKAVKAGAFDFIPKPYSGNKIKIAVDKALENRSLTDEINYLRRQQDIIYDLEGIVAVSAPMKRVITTIRKMADSDSIVLMTGETGTGKSVLSGSIHFNSGRRSKPFLKINCANIPETLLESELFGHEKGAFTGADKLRVGRLEQAKGGTVFLDEIGELTPTLQAKFLRVIEDRSFERLGGNQTICTDIRLIAATNRNLEDLVKSGDFRGDLYYRINVLRIHLPPLRERIECIEPLSRHLLSRICRNARKKIEGFTPEVIELFESYSWPGNIRELSNTIERSVFLEDDRIIHLENVFLPLPSHSEKKASSSLRNLVERERELVDETLAACNWSQKDAAARLGVTPRMLNYKIKKYGITHPKWRKNK